MVPRIRRSDWPSASLPAGGMVPVAPADAKLILQLTTVMGWKPKLPLQIMRDEMAGRWFLKGAPGAQDYWIRDTDIEALSKTPMWPAVLSAAPYGSLNVMIDHPVAKARIDAREEIAQLIVDDPINDPVIQDRNEAAKPRLDAEERLKKLDEWE